MEKEASDDAPYNPEPLFDLMTRVVCFWRRRRKEGVAEPGRRASSEEEARALKIAVLAAPPASPVPITADVGRKL